MKADKPKAIAKSCATCANNDSTAWGTVCQIIPPPPAFWSAERVDCKWYERCINSGYTTEDNF